MSLHDPLGVRPILGDLLGPFSDDFRQFPAICLGAFQVISGNFRQLQAASGKFWRFRVINLGNVTT